MSVQKNYHSITNRAYAYSYIWGLTGYYLLLIVLLCQGCSSNMGSTSRIESIGAPKLVVEKTLYDFGDIRPNSKNTAVFNLTNLGDKPLKITDVKRCCGTIAELDKKELAPGENGVLTVECPVGQTSSMLMKRVGIITNDPHSPQVDLTIKGKVIHTLQWTPARLKLSEYKTNAGCSDITIKSLDGTPFSIKGFTTTGQCLKADFDPAYKATEFTLKPMVDITKLESLQSRYGNIRIELDHRDYQNINLIFDVVPSLQAIPDQILVFNAKANEPVLRPLKLQDNQADLNEDAPFQIESVTSESKARVEISHVNMNKTGCNLELQIWPIIDDKSGLFSVDQLVIKMKDGRVLNVPVRVFYQSRTLSSAANSGSNL